MLDGEACVGDGHEGIHAVFDASNDFETIAGAIHLALDTPV